MGLAGDPFQRATPSGPYRMKQTITGTSGSEWYSILLGKKIVTEFWAKERAEHILKILNEAHAQ